MAASVIPRRRSVKVGRAIGGRLTIAEGARRASPLCPSERRARWRDYVEGSVRWPGPGHGPRAPRGGSRAAAPGGGGDGGVLRPDHVRWPAGPGQQLAVQGASQSVSAIRTGRGPGRAARRPADELRGFAEKTGRPVRVLDGPLGARRRRENTRASAAGPGHWAITAIDREAHLLSSQTKRLNAPRGRLLGKLLGVAKEPVPRRGRRGRRHGGAAGRSAKARVNGRNRLMISRGSRGVRIMGSSLGPEWSGGLQPSGCR